MVGGNSGRGFQMKSGLEVSGGGDSKWGMKRLFSVVGRITQWRSGFCLQIWRVGRLWNAGMTHDSSCCSS